MVTSISSNKCFGGVQSVFSHESRETGCVMRCGIFLPPQAERGKVPVLYWLSGLTCTEENFIVKAGAQRVAAELGLAIIAPDTSPRGLQIPEVAVVSGHTNWAQLKRYTHIRPEDLHRHFVKKANEPASDSRSEGQEAEGFAPVLPPAQFGPRPRAAPSRRS